MYAPLIVGASILPVDGFEPAGLADRIQQWGGTFALTVAPHLQDLLTLGRVLLGPSSARSPGLPRPPGRSIFTKQLSETSASK